MENRGSIYLEGLTVVYGFIMMILFFIGIKPQSYTLQVLNGFIILMAWSVVMYRLVGSIKELNDIPLDEIIYSTLRMFPYTLVMRNTEPEEEYTEELIREVIEEIRRDGYEEVARRYGLNINKEEEEERDEEVVVVAQ